MENISNFDKRIAECVGLWLAEGDMKTESEITFTNNCLELIDLFYKTLSKLFNNKKFRIYTYSKKDEIIKLDYKHCIIKNYYDPRARRPYFILRLFSKELIKIWKNIVKDKMGNENLFPYILRGFFAGEGNLKEGSHCSRIIRVSQKKNNYFFENVLDTLGITNSFRQNERNYYIYGKPNWDTFAKLKLADLHTEKRDKFWRMYGDFKEEHYKSNYLLEKIYPYLENPRTTKELSKKFNRSFARIQDILIKLKKQGKIRNFRIQSIDYWTNKLDLIIISEIKRNYLLFLDKSRKTHEFAKNFNVCHKSSFKRLKELEKLGLVVRDNKKNWERININIEVVTIS